METEGDFGEMVYSREQAAEEVAEAVVRMVEDSEEKERRPRGEFIKFRINGEIHRITLMGEKTVIADITVYNPTKPILENGEEHLFGREESLEREDDSEIVVFNYNKAEDVWELDENGPKFEDAQDPFYCGEFSEIDETGAVHKFKVLGGVKIEKNEKNEIINWKTVFYKYENSIDELKGSESSPFITGPDKMKDIRIIQLDDGSIGVFTRPQNSEGFGGLGRIGYMNIEKIDDLKGALQEHLDKEEESSLISGLYKEGEWGGANELHKLKNGLIGVLCHVARIGPDGKKHYEAASFVYNPKNGRHTALEVLTTADDFDYVPPKKGNLGKVIFTGGLLRQDDAMAWLYVGVGDVVAGRIKIPDPFVKYDRPGIYLLEDEPLLKAA